jgi:general secretion pathway protein G
MMIVIAIIAILMALTAAAVLRFVGKGREVAARNDVHQLALAMEAFKTKFGAYPPSRIHLCYNTSFYGNSQLDTDSLNFMRQMFPRCYDPIWSGQNSGIQWGPNVTAGNANGVILEGDQCLVFFLGGQQVNGQCIGFSANPQNPCDGGTGIGPFYEFSNSRLNSSRPNGFFIYLDAFGKQPYAYFSSYKSRNNYNRYYNAQTNPTSDCNTLGVWPYADPSNTYYNPSTFQILCAGADTTFGQGTNLTTTPPPPPPTWTPGNGPTSGTMLPMDSNNRLAGLDDISNFYDLLMGS